MIEVKDLLKAQELARSGVLFAPASFLKAEVEDLVKYCNGCGASDSWFRPPERIYGTLIVYACIIHDWGYTFGLSIDEKNEDDRIFHNNMNRLITLDSHKFYKPTYLQRRRALKYYLAVKHYGGEAYWAGKNKSA